MNGKCPAIPFRPCPKNSAYSCKEDSFLAFPCKEKFGFKISAEELAENHKSRAGGKNQTNKP